MSIRDKLNQNKPASLAASAAALILGISFVSYYFVTHRAFHDPTGPATTLYFTNDNGNSFFEFDRKTVPPFTKDGVAVQAVMFRCDKMRFIGYLRKFTPEGKAKMEAFIAVNPKFSDMTWAMQAADLPRSQQMVKKPKDPDDAWVTVADPKAKDIMDVKCPASGTGMPVEVAPNDPD